MRITLGFPYRTGLLTWGTSDILGCRAGLFYVLWDISQHPWPLPLDVSSTLSLSCDNYRCIQTFLTVPWEAQSPVAGNRCCRQACSRHCLSALNKQSRSRQKFFLLSTKLSPAKSQLGNCSSRQLGSWFPQGDSHISLSVGVSWLCVLTRPLVCWKELWHQTHQSPWMHS